MPKKTKSAFFKIPVTYGNYFVVGAALPCSKDAVFIHIKHFLKMQQQFMMFKNLIVETTAQKRERLFLKSIAKFKKK